MDLVIEYKLFVGKFMWIHKVGGPMLPKEGQVGKLHPELLFRLCCW